MHVELLVLYAVTNDVIVSFMDESVRINPDVFDSVELSNFVITKFHWLVQFFSATGRAS